MDFFRIHSPEDLASLPSGTWGIKEPDELWEGQKRTSSALSSRVIAWRLFVILIAL
jgi:5-formyltetrahydrofolate cyclo-ligase